MQKFSNIKEIQFFFSPIESHININEEMQKIVVQILETPIIFMATSGTCKKCIWKNLQLWKVAL